MEKHRESLPLSGAVVGFSTQSNRLKANNAKHSTPKALSVITTSDGLCVLLKTSLRQS
jgi:hypothetical protein